MVELNDLYNLIKAWIDSKNLDNGCHNCAYRDVKEWEMPCVKCSRACKDYWHFKGVDDG